MCAMTVHNCGTQHSTDKKKKISHRPRRSVCMGAHPLWDTLSRRGLNPIKIAHNPSRPVAPLTASAFNRLGQCANSPDNRTYCYAEVAISSLAVAVTIASTHYANPWRDGQAKWAWVAWLDTKTVYPHTVTHLSTNPARRRVTSLIRPTMLPLSQTATWPQKPIVTSVLWRKTVLINFPLFLQTIITSQTGGKQSCAILHLFKTALQE